MASKETNSTLWNLLGIALVVLVIWVLYKRFGSSGTAQAAPGGGTGAGYYPQQSPPSMSGPTPGFSAGLGLGGAGNRPQNNNDLGYGGAPGTIGGKYAADDIVTQASTALADAQYNIDPLSGQVIDSPSLATDLVDEISADVAGIPYQPTDAQLPLTGFPSDNTGGADYIGGGYSGADYYTGGYSGGYNTGDGDGGDDGGDSGSDS